MERDTFIAFNCEHELQGTEGSFQLDLDLQIVPGEILAISGKSGAGKTSLVRILAGLLKPSQGFLSVLGKTWISTEEKIFLPPQERSVGMVFQDYALFPHMTVMENLLFALRKGEDKQWPEQLLNQMELASLKDQKPAQLSGGQKQRVAIIRALIQKPSLLLLDEPLSALDESLRRQIQQDIQVLQKQVGSTTLWISHSLIELSSVADRVLILEQGKVKQLGPPEEVLHMDNSRGWEGEILKDLGNGEYWVRVGNNPYRLFLEGKRKPGDKIYLEPKELPPDNANNS